MGHFSAIFSCFVPSASSRVTGEAHDKAEIPKSKSKSSGAPIVASYFPMNSHPLQSHSHPQLTLTSASLPSIALPTVATEASQ
ncbi:hypothetical protein SADUNF_Sadunf16G0120600 [Salix dunnii]|uniref:Uncharacterized protein n=1 Tax=Salix dunnii TaxID=1413687 RepID=A0A835JAN8_9ROSI|nr:hypothetical protein SADUNF_Sadunf16G0120600 [Salix dunnii]